MTTPRRSGEPSAPPKRALGFRRAPRYESRLGRLENTKAGIAGKLLTLEEAAALIPSS
jgi:hypothetical protein